MEFKLNLRLQFYDGFNAVAPIYKFCDYQKIYIFPCL